MTDMERTDLNRVLVLGGQGVLGRMIAEAFAAAGWTAVRAGRRPDSGADFRRVDLAEPETVEKALGEADLIVTTVPDERLVAERLVLERRGAAAPGAGTGAGHGADERRHRPPHPDRDQPAPHDRRLPACAVRPTALPGLRRVRRRLAGAAADGKTVTTYARISERLINSAMLAFNSAGIIGRLPLSVFAGGASGAPTCEQVAHWVAVRRGGALLAARTLRCRGDYPVRGRGRGALRRLPGRAGRGGADRGAGP